MATKQGIDRWIEGSTSSSNWGYRIHVTETIDDEANTSTITISSQFGRKSGTGDWYMQNGYVKETIYIDGVKQGSSSNYTRQVYMNRGTDEHRTFYAGVWDYTRTGNATSNYLPSSPVAYWSKTIEHSPDGTKSISIRLSTTTDITPGTASISTTTVALTPTERRPAVYVNVGGGSNNWKKGVPFPTINGVKKEPKQLFVWVEDTEDPNNSGWKESALKG